MLYSEAKARLERMLAASDDPVLVAADIADLLKYSRRMDDDGMAVGIDGEVWEASAAYALGDQVVPTAHNGHVYEVTASDGASGAVEPVWPVVAAASVILDGVTYQESGAALWAGAWNLAMAAAEGWRWKAAKAASRFDFNSDVSSFRRDQLFKHCLEMVKFYEQGDAWTIDLGGGVLYDPVIGNLNPAP